MANKKAQRNARKGKTRRVSKDKIANYWNVNHLRNMIRRALRVLRRFGKPEADRFISLHSNRCRHCDVILDAKYRQLI